ncbi:uncharacterized protein BO72DRAFT_452890 [Aspergillus fijiensis CBS 313.89]|uniref:Secreted protein n=1 Tax=Aspergillus fijiensis CBS 313.89 TaxID=1448319 RepID=A0A8G1RG89_9EURO|nr:uncharacterized protein BO72DRAFT_452890 [Aspergillus fijiensis CBS 313.89]RAK72193.1 hypothetical protein BO72DRAFT_452890 [Aspergillus fijiensis CBS 313.89]
MLLLCKVLSSFGQTMAVCCAAVRVTHACTRQASTIKLVDHYLLKPQNISTNLQLTRCTVACLHMLALACLAFLRRWFT